MEEHTPLAAGGLEEGLVEEHTDTGSVVEKAEAPVAAHSWGLQTTVQDHYYSCSGGCTGYCCRDLPCGLETVAAERAEAQAHQSVRFCCRNTWLLVIFQLGLW